MLLVLLTIIHVIVCLFLVVVVLLQSGKAADLAGAFGGMGSQTAFGPRGAATVLSKATTIAAGLFMLTSLTLAIMATKQAGTASSVLERQKATAPAGQQKQGAPPVTAAPEGQGIPIPLPQQGGQAAPATGQPAAPAAQPPAGQTAPAPAPAK